MKQKTKAAAVLSAAVVLTMGAAFTSMAAWQQEDNRWVFTDNRGNRVTDSWRQSGGNYFYLDSNGIMATDRWVDDTYYVDINGVRVSDRWVQVEEGTEDAPNSDGGWYYLDSNGRAVTEGWRTINNQRYHFDSDGTMQYGWFNDEDNLYYLGDENDGAAKTGWLNLEYDEDEGQEDGTVAEQSSTGTWYYFQANGRAVKATGDNSYINRTINGFRYYFDENGAMATGWVAIGEREDGDMTGISTLKYFGDSSSGQMARGWRYLTDDPEDSSDNDQDFSFGVATSSNATPSNAQFDGDGAWYYFNNSGVPAYLDENATSLTNATTRINGHRYFFDEYGRMKSGLIGFTQPDGTVINAYFGSDDSDGTMKNNRQTNVIEEDGVRSTFYFTTTGGYTGARSGYLYNQGKLVQAEDGEDIQVFEVDGRLYLVNKAGRIQDSNRAYRADREYRYEYNNGTIYYINADRERLGEVTSGERLPEISYEAVYTLYGSVE
mgnify:CR=1 FL=1